MAETAKRVLRDKEAWFTPFCRRAKILHTHKCKKKKKKNMHTVTQSRAHTRHDIHMPGHKHPPTNKYTPYLLGLT